MVFRWTIHSKVFHVRPFEGVLKNHFRVSHENIQGSLMRRLFPGISLYHYRVFHGTIQGSFMELFYGISLNHSRVFPNISCCTSVCFVVVLFVVH